jgi:hypothetical protein
VSAYRHADAVLTNQIEADRERLLDRLLPDTVPPERKPKPRPRVVVRRAPVPKTKPAKRPARPKRTPMPKPKPRRAADDGLVPLDSLDMTGQTQTFARETR